MPTNSTTPAFNPRCGKCDYAVRGLPTHTCPECGSDFSVVGVRTGERALAVPWFAFGLWGSTIVVVLIVSFLLAQIFVYNFGPRVRERDAQLSYTLSSADWREDDPVSTKVKVDSVHRQIWYTRRGSPVDLEHTYRICFAGVGPEDVPSEASAPVLEVNSETLLAKLRTGTGKLVEENLPVTPALMERLRGLTFRDAPAQPPLVYEWLAKVVEREARSFDQINLVMRDQELSVSKSGGMSSSSGPHPQTGWAGLVVLLLVAFVGARIARRVHRWHGVRHQRLVFPPKRAG